MSTTEYVKKFYKILISMFPTPLPLGVSAYEAWLNDIVYLTGPIADDESLKWVISQEILRLSPGRDRVSRHRFVKLIRKYAANQIAANKIAEIKDAQKAREELAKQSKAEDTAAKDAACPPITKN